MKYKAGSRRRAAEYEPAIEKWWKENKTFEQSVEGRSADDAYVFYDGPPFITGAPHHGTLLSSIVKDAVPRFWTMRGKQVERRWGWDCHGLPAENFVEKQLGITDRREIGEKWSLEDYILKARESMVANSETWEGVIDRVGRWVNFKGAYRTMDKEFMESVWWAFKTLYDKGLIYEGRKVLMYDTKFATPVSKAEVTMDNDAYQTVTDPSAYVKFELTPEAANTFCELALRGGDLSLTNSQKDSAASGENSLKDSSKTTSVYLLAWTTTPWTLPANLALAVQPELEYGIYEVDGERLIMATSRAEAVLGADMKPLEVFSGEKLVGLGYKPILGQKAVLGAEKGQSGEIKRDTYHVLAGKFVSDEDGTGVVHIAPAYGEEDYEVYLAHELDFADVLDDNGYYLPEVAKALKDLGVRDTDEHGIEVWAANKIIAKVLEARGDIWKIEYIQHEYPFNPRSKQRIMYRAFPSWFFDVQKQKPLLLEKNEDINWFPPYLKHGRFEKNIEQAPDWNLSRDRFWATAMPVWKGNKGSIKVVGSYDELYELSGVRLEDYHRPWVDEVEFEIDGEHFKRVEKVLDCWFESGSMPFAQLHYPFENKEKFEKNYPADFIVEYVGQVRAWFYYLHVVNVSLFGEAPFKNVITTGTLAGNDGRKMSKSLGNYTDPNELMNKFSADSLRFLLLSSPVLSGEDFALTDKDVSDVARKLAMIWNVYDFFTTYASVDQWDSESANKFLEDRASRQPAVAGAARPAFSAVACESSSRNLLGAFANPLDRWIISRVHQLRNEVTEGMEKYDIPGALSSMLPFIDDLSNWFVRRSRRRFWKSEDDDDKAEAYATLYYVLVYLAKILAPFTPFLAEELYQKMTGGEGSVHLLDWPEAGEIDEKVLEEMARTREIITEGLALRMQKSETEQQIKVRQPLASLTYAREKLPEAYEQMIADEVNVKTVKNGKKLALDKKLTPELKAEGFVRELIRVVQAARKKAGLNVDDRIRLYVSCEVEEPWLDVLAKETLAITVNDEEQYRYTETAKVNGEEVTVSLEKV